MSDPFVSSSESDSGEGYDSDIMPPMVRHMYPAMDPRLFDSLAEEAIDALYEQRRRKVQYEAFRAHILYYSSHADARTASFQEGHKFNHARWYVHDDRGNRLCGKGIRIRTNQEDTRWCLHPSCPHGD